MYKLRDFIHSTFRREEMKSLIEARKKLSISPQELNNLRKKKFIYLINYAKQNSPYFKRTLEVLNVENLSDLQHIPFLTKDIIRKEYNNIISQRDIQYLQKNSTSGSTSAATYFGTDIRSINYNGARLIRANEMNKHYRYLDKMVVFWGAERDILNKWNLKRFYNYYIKQIRVISTYHLTKKDIQENIYFLNKWKPTLIVGYPSALSFMAEYIANNLKELKHFPKAVIAAGEMLYPVQRDIIEKSFRSEVFNRYGSREFVQIASECSSHSGLHYEAEDLIIEILDENDKPCPPNVVGNLVITDLNNFVFPMIRYKIGDMASFADEVPCSCGNSLPKLKEIEGRSFDVIHGVNGNNVSGSFWTLTFRHQITGIECFQVKKRVINEIEVRLKVNKEFNLLEKEKIKNIIKEKLGQKTKVIVNLVEEFEYTATGKFKWIVSDLNKG